MHDFDEQEESLSWTVTKWAYWIFKAVVITGLITGILISQQCRDFMSGQVKEICELIRICG